jgi:hypothetical protein
MGFCFSGLFVKYRDQNHFLKNYKGNRSKLMTSHCTGDSLPSCSAKYYICPSGLKFQVGCLYFFWPNPKDWVRPTLLSDCFIRGWGNWDRHDGNPNSSWLGIWLQFNFFNIRKYLNINMFYNKNNYKLRV